MKERPMQRRAFVLALAASTAAPALRAQAGDAVDTLRRFVREVKSGQATFTQTVTAADGQRRKTSSGEFEFARPDRFRFAYRKPFEQLIVGDGQKVWLFDPELNQASSRRQGAALGSTPAALLAGGTLEPAFELSPLPAAEGLAWAMARPRDADAALREMRVGFRGSELAAVEVLDGFGQRTRLAFSGFKAGVALPAERFRFVPPPGADVVEQ
jgi:outer membrane lipoprotein carrier protein